MERQGHFETDVDPKYCVKYRPTLDCTVNSFTLLHHLRILFCTCRVCFCFCDLEVLFGMLKGFFENHKLCFHYYIFCLNSTVAFKKN